MSHWILIDKSKLQEIKGKQFTAKELLNLFGYSKKSFIPGSRLAKFVKVVDPSASLFSMFTIYEVI